MASTDNSNAKECDIMTAKNRPRLPYLSHFVHTMFPPPRPRYGPYTFSYTENDPKGIRRLLYKAFPPDLQIGVPWYSPSLASKVKASQAFYSSYTGLEGTELLNHVQNIRDKAWAIMPYPSIGCGWFLLAGLSVLEIWPEVVEAAKEGKTVLDLGCGLGQDLRRLHTEVDGPAKLYGIDLSKATWELGCELFGDGNKPVAEFRCVDLKIGHLVDLNTWVDKEGLLRELRRSTDVILMSQILDLFSWHEQIAIGETIAGLSKVGTKVIGCTFGTVQGSACEGRTEDEYGSGRFYHDDCSTLTSLWMDIGSSTGTKWKVDVKSVELEEWGFDKEDIACIPLPTPRGLNFVFTRES